MLRFCVAQSEESISGNAQAVKVVCSCSVLRAEAWDCTDKSQLIKSDKRPGEGDGEQYYGGQIMECLF